MIKENHNNLLKWIRLIQKSLSVEAESGFKNIKGRQDSFHVFLARQLGSPPQGVEDKSIRSRLSELSKEFFFYPGLVETKRRHLIAKTRQFFHNLLLKIDPPSPIAPPSLNVFRPANVTKKNDSNSRLTLDSPIYELKGIGNKIKERLSAIGLILVRDLLHYYPRDYVDYSSLRRISGLITGEPATIVASVRRCNAFRSPRNQNLSILELHLQDSTGRIKVARFFAGKRFSNYSYLQSQTKLYPSGVTVAVSGLVKEGPYGKSFQDPLIEVVDESQPTLRSKNIGRILPVYSLTEGIKADRFRGIVESVLYLTKLYPDYLSQSRRQVLNLLTRSEALIAIHIPNDRKSLKEARRRIVFDEFFLMQLGLLRRRMQIKAKPAPYFKNLIDKDSLTSKFLDSLPYRLTKAQTRVIKEIKLDLGRSEPMNRLLQGDVGSGKTIVSVVALLQSVQSGWQGALMAPTEVLAEQHYRNLSLWLPNLNVNVELLTGSTSRLRRQHIIDDLANGSTNILVGTHALIEDPVVFSRLGLVVVDEQHRFGVAQRNRLMNKGLHPHLLTMTATPIPRTLALSVHGDLDISHINELPAGRLPIETRLILGSKRDDAYQLIRNEISQGNSAYVVLPLVEESEKLDLKSAIDVHQHLSEEVFPEINVGLLHGRMSGLEKQSVIKQFSSGDCKILVSTTVVEVGVDVPNATVMMIENADRFGLAQLHQLRGRVGRGNKKSFCFLITDNSQSLSRERLKVLVKSNDGFEISELDLRLRGPGQVLGTRQSGMPDFVLASLVDDAGVLEEARNEALFTLKQDPFFLKNQLLKELLDSHWTKISGSSHLN